jgi:hypothetical protein
MEVRVVLEVVVVGIACWLEEGAAVLVSLKVWEGKVVGWGKQVVRCCKNEKVVRTNTSEKKEVTW